MYPTLYSGFIFLDIIEKTCVNYIMSYMSRSIIFSLINLNNNAIN